MYPAIIAGTGATVIVKGTVSTAEGNGVAVGINCGYRKPEGTLIIEKAKAGGEASAIYVDTIPGVSQEYILNSLPDIVVESWLQRMKILSGTVMTTICIRTIRRMKQSGS